MNIIKKRMKRLLSFNVNLIKSWFQKKAAYKRMKYNHYLNKKIKKKTILFEAYLGKSMTGNCFSLFKSIYEDQRFNDYNIIWSLVDITDANKVYIDDKRVKFIKKDSKLYLNYLATSEYLVTDTTFPFYFNKRSSQRLIMSWHGTPYKKIGKDIVDAAMGAHSNVMKNILHTDYFISPCEFTTKTLLSSQDVSELYSGEVIEYGMPRTDLSFGIDAGKIKKNLNLPLDKKIVLYAPTWNDFSENIYTNVSELVSDSSKLQQILGEDYLVALKVHYLEYDAIEKMNTNTVLIDNAIDTNELLAICDILVTDYSSIMFDFLPLRRPMFFYYKNYEEYSGKRGLYLTNDELPGEICSTVEQLAKLIEKVKYKDNLSFDNYVAQFCPHDDGAVSERVINYIFFNEKSTIGNVYKKESNKNKILIYGGYFKNNGITQSLIRMLNNIDYSKNEVAILVPRVVKKNSDIETNLKKINPNVIFIYNTTRIGLTFLEEYYYWLYTNRGLNGFISKLPVRDIFKKEYKKVIGNVFFDKIIDFSGYNSYYGSLVAFSTAGEKIVYLHSDMRKDMERVVKRKRPNKLPLQVMMSIYTYFDKLLSVSSTSNLANIEKIGKPKDIADRMDYIENFLDAESIIKMSKEYSQIDISNKTMLVNKIDDVTEVQQVKIIKKPSKKYINYVNLGRLSPEKNHELLIKAFKKVCHTQKNSRLYIIGEGPERKKIEKLIDELGLQESVILTGHLDNPFYLLKYCDVFVLTSKYEGQALVVIEALALGLKVVSTDIPGPDYILCKGFGELVEPTEIGLSIKMLDIASSEKEYKKLDPFRYDEQVKKKLNEILNS